MDKKAFVEIIAFTDPVCTWCWGNEPILRKLETVYEGNIEINFIMGGLVEDIRGFQDDLNGIGGNVSKINAQVGGHWVEASSKHGMPVEGPSFNLFSEEYPSTYPLNIAYKAAQFQDEKLAKKFLRRMREAAACEGKQANRDEVLIELAQESGLDVAKFIKNFTDGSAEQAFYEDLKITRSHGVHGFPTFLIKCNGKEIMLRGFQTYEAFKEVINYLSNGELQEREIEGTESTILDFIHKYGRVAPVELKVAFDLSSSKLEEILESLKEQRRIKSIAVGNGYMVEIETTPLSCDPVTGVCNI